MVYDPIRDCEVPSPATEYPQHEDPWRRSSMQTPESAFSESQDPRGTNGHHHPLPPGWQHDGGRPYSPSRPNLPRSGSSSSGLRGLLNDDPSPDEPSRGSQKSNWSPSEEDPRPSIQRLFNDRHSPSSQAISKSNSATSLTHSASPPAHASPGPRAHYLDPAGFLTPATPAVPPRRGSSRSPYPHASASPAYSSTPLPPDGYSYYPEHHAGPSSRRTSTASNNAAMPPPILPTRSESYDHGLRSAPPGLGGSLPLRSPSVSVSPRSQFAHLPPHQPLTNTSSNPSFSSINNNGSGSSSRPGSATSASHPFSFQPQPLASPSTSARRLSEDPHPSAPGSSSSRRGPRRSSFVSQGTPVRSPSPVPPPPYAPNRISQPNRSLFQPITPDEIHHLKALGLNNNPLRKNRKPAPSWSGTPRAQPENQDSYFPQQEDNMGRKKSAVKREEISPQAMARHASGSGGGYPALSPKDEKPGKRAREDGPSSGHLKRPSDDDDDKDGIQRRKVSGGNAAAVQSHYNARPEVGKDGREKSPIIGLRKFNNWIKSVLIGKATLQPPLGFGHGNGAKVLDIGCGKGGDLIKWKHAQPQLYVGVDLADQSIEQAKERYETMLYDPRFRNRRAQMFPAEFYAHDCYGAPISEALPDYLQQREFFDITTLQFCMHYAFESAIKVRMMLENATRYLRTGGIFIGTIPNAEMILNRLETIPDDSPSYSFGNDCYEIAFTEKRHRGIYGHQYHFYLADAVDVPEYLVLWDEFVALAEEYSLKVVYRKTFNEILQEEQGSRDFGPLLKKMGVLNQEGQSEMDAAQWEAANLYMAFAFQKI